MSSSGVRTGPIKGRGRGRPKTGAESIAQAERLVEMMALRRAGMTLDQIGLRFGVTREAVSQRISNCLRKQIDPSVDEYRKIEGDRLEALLRAVWSKAITGDLLAVDRALRIHESICRLYGIGRSQLEGLTIQQQINTVGINLSGLSEDDLKRFAEISARLLEPGESTGDAEARPQGAGEPISG